MLQRDFGVESDHMNIERPKSQFNPTQVRNQWSKNDVDRSRAFPSPCHPALAAKTTSSTLSITLNFWNSARRSLNFLAQPSCRSDHTAKHIMATESQSNPFIKHLASSGTPLPIPKETKSEPRSLIPSRQENARPGADFAARIPQRPV